MYFGNLVYLRLMTLEDVDHIMTHFNDLELRSTLMHQLPMSREEEEDWIRNTWRAKQKGEAYVFSIIEKKSEEWLGNVGLTIKPPLSARRAELGIAIMDKTKQGKGYGTDAVRTMCAFGFQILGLNSIMLKHVTFNEQGRKAYEKVGFKEVGRERQATFVLGKFYDMVIMDILRSEFEALYPNLSLFPS